MPGLRSSQSTRKWLYTSPPVEWATTKLQEVLISSLRQGPIPPHVAFIMDGNRRFARKCHIETTEGHNLGFEALARILEVCYKSGVKVVTIYAFSIENFKRSKYEVDVLMDIAKIKLSQLAQHGDLLDRYGASIRILGQRSLVNEDVLEAMDRATNMTKHNKKAILNVCFPYTSRDEITSSIRSIVRNAAPSTPLVEMDKDVAGDSMSDASPAMSDSTISNSTSASTVVEDASGSQVDSTAVQQHAAGTNLGQRTENDATQFDIESVTEQTITENLFTGDNPPVDLLVRTSGVERLSDFMLWQVHQDTDIRFVKCMWPEFDIWHFLPMLLSWGLKKKKHLQEVGYESKTNSRRIELRSSNGWVRGWDSEEDFELRKTK